MQTGTILLILGVLAFMAVWFARMYSCGGRENCGRRWCPIGLMDDYEIFVKVVGVILIMAGIYVGIDLSDLSIP